MPLRRYFVPLLFLLLATQASDAAPLELEVDARDLPRKLMHSRIQIPCKPGALRLWYPKWIPGSHGPYGRIEDIGGLRIESDAGKIIPWKRDEVELNCFVLDVPEGTSYVVVHLDTICNVSSPNAVNVYTYGTKKVGVINWNTCLLYPEGPSCHDIEVNLSLKLPPKWKFASSLKVENDSGGRSTFKRCSLSDLIDSPMIAGENCRSFKLEAGNNPPAFLDLVGDSADDLNLDPKVVEFYARLVREACALFGAAHYPEYHFLVTCSNDLGTFGLEHLACSLNGVGNRDLIEDGRRRAWVANLLPHEYAHSWCGKYRRPSGMCVENFHTPQKTKLVWVYEGLTEYLGEILSVRCGLISPQEYRETIAANLGDQLRRKGRKWRSLEDTAVANHVLRAPSNFWSDLRRDQDFYSEGSLIWWEVDVTIRKLSQGKHSLDDFCRKFMGPQDREGKVIPYDLPEMVKILKELADHDWDHFFARRVSAPMDTFPLDVAGEAGYRVSYGKTPSGLQEYYDRDSVNARDSLGLTFSNDGQITGVVLDGLGDKKGLHQDVKVIGVNGKKFSRHWLTKALEESLQTKRVELLIERGDDLVTVLLPYGDGPRFIQLVRDEKKPDLLGEIMKPRVELKKEKK